MADTGKERHVRLADSEHKRLPTRILALNPNSSPSITYAMADVLIKRGLPPGCEIVCATAPESSPESINDPPTSIASTTACMRGFEMSRSEGGDRVLDLDAYDAVLVGCFSSHPLVHCLRHHRPDLPSMHILESSVLSALGVNSGKFGIITTGQAMVADIDAGVLAVLGGASTRYVGTVATNVPVLHLQDATRASDVHKIIKAAAQSIAERGARTIILGCAGMAGMETLVREGAAQARPGGSSEGAAPVAVIDGTVVGCHLLAGLARSNLSG